MASTSSTSVPTPEVNSDDSDLITLVSRVYRDAWDEYHIWSLRNSEGTLRNPTRSPYTRPPPLPQELPAESPPQPSEISDDLEAFTITDFEASGSAKETWEVSSRPITVDKVLRPYPPYESCTPISRNIMVGDDPDYLPFMPFSDDPSYDYTYDVGEHKYFAWPAPNSDPDTEVIAYETTRRLVVDHRISYEDIDETEFLPFSTEEIRKFHRKRDFPRWRDPKDLAPLPKSPISTTQGPKEITNYFLSTFCSNLNCVTGFCTTHLETQPPSAVPPRIPYSKLADIVQEPCGRDCFMQPISAENSVGTFWQRADTEFLFSFLDYAPDSSSCDLAAMCRKPCREIHKQRAKYRSRSATAGAATKNGKTYRIYHVDTTARATPAQAARARKTRRIVIHGVDVSKAVRGDGKAAPAPNRVQENSAGRTSVHAIWPTSNAIRKFAYLVEHDENLSMCKNVSIQRGYSKRTEVRESKWGLGLFMLESCDEGDLIAEYVGELICEPTFDSRNAHTNHRGRSYVFKLNPTFSVDGANAGNATRYINHSPNANCGTTVCLVNGEHRVGIYAGTSTPSYTPTLFSFPPLTADPNCPPTATRLEKGDELFINYGPKFFISSSGSPKDGPNLPAEAEGTSLDLPAFVMPTYEHASDATYSEESDVSMGDGSEPGEP
ncbi:unnamed protein product [Cyclocybe aegerita]|uniref:SET domain-containing protein n=1 Tax=Cyclocybe aegerita TaxID=1973307 RepID=A0A8S0X0Y6_CYCAE|nr:unnamed protein product [Cyclocybe aegerita]